METVVIAARRRKVSGRRANQYLRRNAQVPAIIYGHKEEPEPISLPRHELGIALEHGAHLLELDIEGQKENVLIKEVQFDYLGIDVIHVDLARVDLTETVHLRVPIEYKGEPIGAHEGGVLDHHLMELEIECQTANIPSSIVVKVDALQLGASLYARDVVPPPGIRIVTHGDDVVCTVRAATAAATVEAVAATEEEQAAEPEVISRGKEEPKED